MHSAMSSLLQSAPRQLRVCPFFYNNPASQWHEVPKFLKTMTGQSADVLFQKYKSSLDTIASSDAPKPLRQRAKKISENITKEVFEEQCEDYSLGGKKRQAQNAMLGAFYDLMQGVGSKSLMVPTTDSNKGRVLKRTKSNMSEDSEGVETDESNGGYSTPPPKQDVKLAADFNMKVFECLGQRCAWSNGEDVDLVRAFKLYKDQHIGIFELSNDEVMDLTSGSTFVTSLSDVEHEFVLDNSNLMDDTIVIDDLVTVFKDAYCFEDVEQWTYKNILDTPIKRLLLTLVDNWGGHYESRPKILEKQAVADFLTPIICSSFKQVGMVTLTGEIPVAAVSWRKNFKKDPRLDKMERSHYADIVITSKTGEQVCILESSRIDEEKQEKHVQDHWKIARLLRDMWNFKAEKLSLTRRIPSTMATYGMQYFGGRLRFYQLDFCGGYRFFEIGSAEVPLAKDDFVSMTPQYIKAVMQFASRIQQDIQNCEKSPLLTQREKLERARELKLITQTTPTPKSRKVSSGKRET
ncbi:hypothetical protein BGX27_001787 [Mortierella sp. AM989]|nr:hypothetical protein BGX27_001787 [Mortierella sp. AM989]